MVKLLEIGYTEVPTLAGLKYTHNNLDEAVQCVQLYNRTFKIFLGNDQVTQTSNKNIDILHTVSVRLQGTRYYS